MRSTCAHRRIDYRARSNAILSPLHVFSLFQILAKSAHRPDRGHFLRYFLRRGRRLGHAADDQVRHPPRPGRRSRAHAGFGHPYSRAGLADIDSFFDRMFGIAKPPSTPASALTPAPSPPPAPLHPARTTLQIWSIARRLPPVFVIRGCGGLFKHVSDPARRRADSRGYPARITLKCRASPRVFSPALIRRTHFTRARRYQSAAKRPSPSFPTT